MENLLMGIGLSSSTGYKPFIPLLIISISSRLGIIELADYSQWISSTLFICMMLLLSILEIFSTSIPLIGRLFDVIGIPITLICGYIAITSLTGHLGENNIIIKHLIGVLLGGGSAAIVKALTIITNTLSDTVTLGLSSSVNSVKDSIIALFLSVIAIVAPILVCIILVVILFMTYKVIKRLKKLKEFGYSKSLKSSNS